ncbi:hypothetical protein [Streptomyces sp. CA-106110]|uniref:hypothetical protein n=1 Tax=Streptomyces sp. CA-106110 TaxID=3240044 RepID=UPI003D8C0F11
MRKLVRVLIAIFFGFVGVSGIIGVFLPGGSIGGRIGSGVLGLLFLWIAREVWRGPTAPKPDKRRRSQIAPGSDRADLELGD